MIKLFSCLYVVDYRWATFGFLSPLVTRLTEPAISSPPGGSIKLVWSLRSDVILPLFCGGVAGAASISFTNFIDVIKTRLQVLGPQVNVM